VQRHRRAAPQGAGPIDRLFRTLPDCPLAASLTLDGRRA